MTAIRRLFAEGFQVFFLSAGLFALISIGIWLLWLRQGLSDLPSDMTPQHWHAHEMVFGYGGAALAGFFLTAVPNWTGGKSAPHRFIVAVWGLWLAGRLALWWSGQLPLWAVALADLAFVPVLAAQMARALIVRPKAPQMIFLGLLGLFWGANLACHLEWLGWTGTASQGLRAGLLTLTTMIVVMGGRVTPGFTRNAMVAAGREDRLPANPTALAAVSIATAIATTIACLLGLPDLVTGSLAAGAGTAALARVTLWRSGWTLDRPILWALHLAYAMNGLGLVTLGFAAFGIGTEMGALHVLAIGGIGGMTLAIMSRASLGHTGRPLVAPRAVAVAYALIPLAMLARWIGAELPEWHDSASLIGGGLWLAAFALYLLALWPVWWRPRLPRAAVGQPQ